MKIGVGLPATTPGVKGPEIMEWARRGDNGPFSSLGIIDRPVYPNYEPLVTLAAVAGTTRRVRLMSTILIAPLRNAGLLAKQAASLDALSGGRLTLGLGIGGREDDYRAAPAGFKNRGSRFEQQLEWMRRIWSGQSPAEGLWPIRPQPVSSGRPEILIGGYTPAVIQRVGHGTITGKAPYTHDIKIYPEARHSFFNDTGPAYRPKAAARRLDAHAGGLRYPFEGLSSRNGVRTQSFHSFCTFRRCSC